MRAPKRSQGGGVEVWEQGPGCEDGLGPFSGKEGRGGPEEVGALAHWERASSWRGLPLRGRGLR